MKKLNFQNKEYSLVDLTREMRLMIHSNIDSFSQGVISEYFDPLDAGEFKLDDLEKRITSCPSILEDASWKNWLNHFEKLKNHLASFNKEYYDHLDKTNKNKREEYAIKYGFKSALLLEPMLETYIDPKDPMCPTCPESCNDSWAIWKEARSPLHFFLKETRKFGKLGSFKINTIIKRKN